MTWDEKRARRSERRWVYGTIGLLLVPVLLVGVVSVAPYVWSWMSWSQQVSSAPDIREYSEMPAGSTFGDLVSVLGEPLMSGPGFESSEGPEAGVYYWSSDSGEVRGLILRGRLVGSLKVGVWR